MSYFRTQLEKWLKEIDVKADKVLDVGGGNNPVEGRTKSWDVKEYKILDLEQPHESRVKPDYECDLNIAYTGYLKDIKADIVFCLEVFEYIWHPVMALRNIKKSMKKNGILYISFPFIYPHHNPVEKDYLRYTRWGVAKLLEEAGFKITQVVSRVETVNYNQRPFVGLKQWFGGQGMHPAKGYNGHNEIGYCVKAIKK